MTPAQMKRFRRALVEWFARTALDHPWRRSRDPYAILVSEVMLQQTTIAMVRQGRYFERWMKAFPDLRALAAAPESRILRLWEGLGYYNRARNLQRAARMIVERHGGRFPETLAEILALPGVGRYTAGAVTSLAFDQQAAVVDGNVARVLARVWDFHGAVDSPAGRDLLWKWAAMLVPARGAGAFNSSLMELGQRVCTPRQPECCACPVKFACRAEHPESLPKKRARREVEKVFEDAVFARRGSKILLERESGSRRRGLWKLPAASGRQCESRVYEGRYAITHHRVTLRVHACRRPGPRRANEAWILRDRLSDVAMAAPHRRALNAILNVPAAAKASTRT